MIGFSDPKKGINSGPLKTKRNEEYYDFHFFLDEVSHDDIPTAWKLSGRLDESQHNSVFELFIVPILNHAEEMVAAQVVQESYSDDNFMGKGIPEALILKWVEYFNIPLFSSVPVEIYDDIKIYADESRVTKATKVWERLDVLMKESSDYKVKYFKVPQLYVIYPANFNDQEILFLKLHYRIKPNV